MKERIGRASMKRQKYVLEYNESSIIWYSCMRALGDNPGGVIRVRL